MKLSSRRLLELCRAAVKIETAIFLLLLSVREIVAFGIDEPELGRHHGAQDDRHIHQAPAQSALTGFAFRACRTLWKQVEIRIAGASHEGNCTS
jgi:hypothetical protein